MITENFRLLTAICPIGDMEIYNP